MRKLERQYGPAMSAVMGTVLRLVPRVHDERIEVRVMAIGRERP